MIQTPSKSWWLLALSGVFAAMYSVMNFFMQGRDGSLALRTFVHHRGTVVDMGLAALGAGACRTALGLWSFRKSKSWLMVLNGLACAVLGLILTFWTGPLAFRTIALLIVVMAICIGTYELATSRPFRSHAADKWLLAGAGVASLGFAFVFLAFVFPWIKLDPASPAQTLHWLGSYFAFSSICMLALALRLRGRGLSQSGEREDVPAFGNPKHALH